MKIRIEIDPEIKESEIVLRCSKLDSEMVRLQEALADFENEKIGISFYKGETEFFPELDEILFFETAGSDVWAHTASDEYLVKNKLYELEEILPRYFMRISKSSILNTKKVYSIMRNLTASSKIEFYGTHKSVFVSRNYYKSLKDRLSFNITGE